MRLLIAGLMVFGLMAVGTVGCQKKTDTSKPKDGGPAAEGDEFKLSVDPADEVKIKAGKTQDVKISVTRGKKFKEDAKIKVTIKDDKHVTSNMKSDEFTKGNDTLTVTLTAADSAPKDHAFDIVVSGDGGGQKADVHIKGKVLPKD